jgi:hypothetical protein
MEQDDYDEEEGEDDDYGNNYFDNGEAEDGDDGGGGGDDGECFRPCFWIDAMLIDSVTLFGEQREHIRTSKTGVYARTTFLLLPHKYLLHVYHDLYDLLRTSCGIHR